MPQKEREYWVKLFLPNEAPSDAVRVWLQETDTCVLDLKKRLLDEVANSLLLTPSVHWTTLTLPPSPADDSDEQRKVGLDSSEELSELPEGAGSKWWHLHADVRLRGEHKKNMKKLSIGLPFLFFTGDLGTTSSHSKGDYSRSKTLHERGIAGSQEQIYGRTAADMNDLYPRGALPAGGRDEFSLFLVMKIVACFALLGMVGIPLVYILERLPGQAGAMSQEFTSELL